MKKELNEIKKNKYFKYIIVFGLIKKVILLIIFLFPLISSTQEEKEIDSIELNSNWKKSGKFTFLGNQSSYSYWTAGGQTSVSGTIKIDYDFNFENNGWNWDTRLITAYGLNSIGGSKFIKKTDDRIEINCFFLVNTSSGPEPISSKPAKIGKVNSVQLPEIQ